MENSQGSHCERRTTDPNLGIQRSPGVLEWSNSWMIVESPSSLSNAPPAPMPT
ncbi:hypothetical protein NQZ68_031719 [Dissostichus eleginoides]|nr:hypothetical protein NQZ68_031719 [Dissostichus eleginoides]